MFLGSGCTITGINWEQNDHLGQSVDKSRDQPASQMRTKCARYSGFIFAYNEWLASRDRAKRGVAGRCGALRGVAGRCK